MASTSKINELFQGNAAFKAGRDRANSYLVIGQEMRSLREHSGLTQQMLAERTGVDQADISRLEAGKWGSRGISFDVLGRLLPVYGLRISHQVSAHAAGAADAERLRSARVISQLLVSEA
jgi:transcriptional regulator with XRE-family HTH domain